MMLKASQNWTGNIAGVLVNYSNYSGLGSISKTVSLTNSWQRVNLTVKATGTLSSTAGIQVRFDNLPVGVTIYAAEPRFDSGSEPSTDWTKWSSWGNRSYWSSESQTGDPTYGNVYAGVNANSSNTYLYNYYPYTVISGTPYTMSVMLKASTDWTGPATLELTRSSDNATVGSAAKQISLTTSWQRFSWTVQPSFNLSSAAGVALAFSNLPSGVTLYAAQPQFEQLPYPTSYTDSTRNGESLTLPNNIFTPSQGTIEAWVKLNSNHINLATQYLQTILDVAETGVNGLIMAVDSNGKAAIQAGTGTGCIQAESTTTLNTNTWYYVAGRWDGSGVTIYVNGIKEGFTAGTPKVLLNSTPTLGRESQAVQRWFDGNIDDLRISSISRTDSDIQAAYQNGTAPLPDDAYTSYKANFDGDLSVSAKSYQPDDWNAYTPAGSINQVEYDSTAPFGGSRVLHINPGSNSYAYQLTDYLNVSGTSPFQLSGYIKSSPVGTTTTDGACLNVYWYDANKNSIAVNRYFNVQNSQWQRYSVGVTPPQNSAYVRVMAITYGPYDGYFDDIQFEQSATVSGYNILDNSSFESGEKEWSPSDGNVVAASDSDSKPSPNDIHINGSSGGTSYLQSQQYLPINQGQQYTLSGSIKSNISSSSGGGARLHVYEYDQSGKYIDDFVTQLIKGDPSGKAGWGNYALTFKAGVSGNVKVRLEVFNASGTADFDNIRLSNGNLISTIAYDGNKNYVVSRTNQLGNTTSYVNDNYGTVTNATSPGGEKNQYNYDGQENLRSVTDNAGNVATYNLDADGNIKESYLTAGANVYDHTLFKYDPVGNLLSETDADNNQTQFTYDEEGRLKEKMTPDGSTVSLGYDSTNNLNQIQLSSGPRYVFGFDKDGRRNNIDVYNGSTLTNHYNYGYDAVGNITSYTEKDGTGNTIAQINNTSYSATNQLKSYNLVYGTSTIPFNFNYSNSNLVTSQSIDSKTYSFNYDGGDNLISVVKPNGTQDSYIYNAANQVIGIETDGVASANGGFSLTPKWSSQYAYNTNGMLVQVIGNGPGSSSSTYTYNNNDKLDRLTDASTTIGTINYNFHYTYDPAGNLSSMTLPNGDTTTTQTFQYDSDNRIKGFTYDNNGNLKQATINGKTYEYEYDSMNRLTAVDDESGKNISTYTYDGDGQRLTKTENGVTTTYHYFSGQLMYETTSSDPANTIHALYIRSSQGGLQAVRLYQNGVYNYYYYHYDAQGNVNVVTDANGNVYRQYFYDPYGNVIKVLDGSGQTVDINNDPGFNNAYTYMGYRYDTESGLYFLNARYYAAGIGRFLTKDSFKGDVTDTGSLNRYAYAEGDPVNFSDPSGNRIIGNDENEYAIVTSRGTTVHYDSGKSTRTATPAPAHRSAPQQTARAIPSHQISVQDDTPDYTSYTISAGLVVGVGITYTAETRDNHHYISGHFDIGKTYTLVSGSVVKGLVVNKTRPSDVSNFLTGWGRNYCAGLFVGAGIGESVYYNLRSVEAGAYIPQFGVSQGYTFQIN